MYNPIKSREFPKDNVTYNICHEPIIEVKDFLFEPYYLNRNITGATERCFMRKSVYERLKIAEDMLPEGLRFKIYDGWRPFEVQLALYNDYRECVKRDNPGLSEEEVNNLTKLFVSLPVKDELRGPVHATGGAVDLTLAYKDGTELDMGTPFDFFGDMANTDYFEKNCEDKTVRDNRRLLYNVMAKAGFTNLPTEWWHYDFGNRFYACYTKKEAVYGCVFDVI